MPSPTKLRTTGEPLLVLLVPVALAAFGAAAQAFLDGATTRGIVTAALGALVTAATAYARSLVRPEVKLQQALAAGRQDPPATIEPR